MELCSDLNVSIPGPPAGFPYPEDPGLDWLRDCLIEAFPIDAAARPAMTWIERTAAATAFPAARAMSKAPTVPEAIDISDSTNPGTTPPERRGEDRSTISVYRSAMLHWDSVEALCLIRNVSSGGMMGKVLIDLPVGTAVLVEMRSGHEIPGHVVWAHDRLVGVQFDTPIDVQQVMNGAHRVMHHWRQRMPRVHVPCPVTLLTKAGCQTVNLLDLSQGGAKIEGDLLREGDDVTLAVKGLAPHRGTIRWACGNRAGIAFLAAIPFEALAFWALERQAEMGRIETPLVQQIAAGPR